jgi:predicted SAM-dependent methyltransferase
MPLLHIKDSSDFELIGTSDNLVRLDLACGNAKKEGFMGIDISEDTQADVIHDLNKYPYPIADNSVCEIHCSHFIEHVADIKKFMEECYRILIKGGIFHIIAPYYTSIRAFQDFTHIRPVSENTFVYFNQEWLKQNGLGHYNVKCDFITESIKYIYSSEWKTRSEAAKEWARVHYFNVVSDIDVILRKR